MKERDTVILAVRIKKTLLERVNEKVKGSRNGWVIKMLNEGLRKYTKVVK